MGMKLIKLGLKIWADTWAFLVLMVFIIFITALFN